MPRRRNNAERRAQFFLDQKNAYQASNADFYQRLDDNVPSIIKDLTQKYCDAVQSASAAYFNGNCRTTNYPTSVDGRQTDWLNDSLPVQEARYGLIAALSAFRKTDFNTAARAIGYVARKAEPEGRDPSLTRALSLL